MFDFGFTELMLVAVVALIVVGPERLPKVARTAGHLLGRLQRYVSDVKSDISREMQLEDLKKLQQQVEEQARDLESSVRSQMHKAESGLDRTASEISRDLSLKGQPASKRSEAQRPLDYSGSAAGTPVSAGDDPARAPDSTAGEEAPQLELELDRAAAQRPPAEKS